MYANKQYSDFEVMTWKNMHNLKDHRGIRISKTGYEIDDETADAMEDEERMKQLLKVDGATSGDNVKSF
jgi:hypothetical protein